MDPDREILLQIAAQARKLSSALESGGASQDWAQAKARLDALLASAPHSLLAAADIAADVHSPPEEFMPAGVPS
jgi:hypothetical protein